MKKKLFTLLTVMVIAMLTISPVGAGGGFKFQSAPAFSLGSLIIKGTVIGLGSDDWDLTLFASGPASAVCTNQGGNAAPGQNYPHVERFGSQFLDGESPLRKNGKAGIFVETEPENTVNTIIPWDEAGCANRNWTAAIDFVYWDYAKLTATNLVTGEVLVFEFSCTTKRTGPNTTLTTFDDGTVSCK